LLSTYCESKYNTYLWKLKSENKEYNLSIFVRCHWYSFIGLTEFDVPSSQQLASLWLWVNSEKGYQILN
jgi:hypothetical protein